MAMVFKPDWSVNVANLLSLAAFLAAGVGAWYDVKSQTVQNTKDITTLIQTQEKHKQEDVASDLRQDAKRDAVVLDLKATIKDTKDDINGNIKDLRNDLYRKH